MTEITNKNIKQAEIIRESAKIEVAKVVTKLSNSKRQTSPNKQFKFDGTFADQDHDHQRQLQEI